jgi:hypothetical protein
MGSIRPKKDAEPLQVVRGAETPLVSRAAGTITRSLVMQVGSIVASCGARAVLLYADALEEEGLALLEEFGCEVFFVTKDCARNKFPNLGAKCACRLGRFRLSETTGVAVLRRGFCD